MEPVAFGRYELLQRLSAGGMAEVFRARDTKSNAIVALKRILPNVAQDPEFITMFEDEARIASQLEHPHIARTLEFGKADDWYYIAFEFVDGLDLRVLFDRAAKAGKMPPVGFLVYAFARICEGLSYAHSRKDAQGVPVSIVHRDVSPQNIVISFSGDIKLIDFGIAKAANIASRTQVGTIKGKFGYMSPEQVRGKLVDQRTDLFSLGICMWELLTLRRLFSAPNELLVLDKVKNQIVEPPSTTNPEVPEELDEIVLKALAKNPDERYRAARELQKDLDSFSEAIGAVGTREEIARFMREHFSPASIGPRGSPSAPPEPRITMKHDPPPSGFGRKSQGRTMQQETRMAEEKQGGSDLDIFEGLAKKSAPPKSAAPPPPAPPGGLSSLGGPPVARAPETMRTLTGGTAGPSKSSPPLPPPSPSQSMRAATPSGSGPAVRPISQPPSGAHAAAPASQPPGRGSLPKLVAPPKLGSSPSAPPPVSTRPVAAASSAPATAKGLEMDWDDEDEATHVFDKDKKDGEEDAPATEQDAAARPAAGTPVPPPNFKATLVGTGQPGPTNGLMAPPPPPPPPPGGPGSFRPGPQASQQYRSAPPPPPNSQSFRSGPPAPPGPPTDGQHRVASVPPAPASVGGAFARASSVTSEAPGPVSQQPPFQQTTQPMPMPGPRPGSLPPPGMQSTPPMHGMPSEHPQGMMSSRAMEATQLVRAPSSSKAGLFVGLAIVLVGLIAAAGVFFAMPRTGRVVVNVADGRGAAVKNLEVVVDGNRRCSAAPCIVEQLSAGVHNIEVRAPGYESLVPRAVTVESRRDSTLEFTMAQTANKGGTGLKVAGNQPGVKLYVDGKEMGPLPQELRDLTPGSHAIRLAGTDRYAAIEKSIIVAQDEVQDLGQQTLKVTKGKATIQLATPGARVYIVSGTDRRELPALPISVDIDTSKSWALEASMAGHNEYKQAISFDDGQAEKSFTVTLESKGSAPANTAATAATTAAPTATATATAAPTATATSTAASTGTAATTGTATSTAAPVATKPKDPTPAAAGEAFLNINSLPASTIVLDGKPVGATPKLHVSVSAGSHTVLFVNSEQQLKKQISVTVGAGETKAAFAKLRE